jgi:hypothetical protein
LARFSLLTLASEKASLAATAAPSPRELPVTKAAQSERDVGWALADGPNQELIDAVIAIEGCPRIAQQIPLAFAVRSIRMWFAVSSAVTTDRNRIQLVPPG